MESVNDVVREVCPIFQFGGEVLIIRKSDLPILGQELGVLSVKIDLKRKNINPQIIDVERYLKFGFWYIIAKEKERNKFIRMIHKRFTDEDVMELVVKPLIAKNRKESIDFGLRSHKENEM